MPAQTKPPAVETPEQARQPNAWILSAGAARDAFTVTLQIDPHLVSGVVEGDAAAVLQEEDGQPRVTLFARIFRVRRAVASVTLYFDSILPASGKDQDAMLGLRPPTGMVERVEWPAFVAALQSGTGKEFGQMPPIEGKTTAEQSYLRKLLQLAVMDDLQGPANGPQEEVVGMSVRDRYLVGKLAPKTIEPQSPFEGVTSAASEAPQSPEGLQEYHGRNEPGAEFNSAEGSFDPDEKDQQANEASASRSLVPSSIGFTFCLDGDVREIDVEVRWGRYVRRPDLDQVEERERKNKTTGVIETVVVRHRVWKRVPSGGTRKLSLTEGLVDPIAIDPDCPEVFVQGIVRPKLAKGDRLVTLFLVNDQPKPDENQDAAWVFQPEVIVRGTENAAVFRRRPVLDADGHDHEREALEMVYRKRVEFAVGHGVAVHAVSPEGEPEKAVEIRSVVIPETEVEVTETPGMEADDRPEMKRLVNEGVLDMEKLAFLPPPEMIKALSILTHDYLAWIVEQKSRIPIEFRETTDAAIKAMDRCSSVAVRLMEGIKVLEQNIDALEAFRFANLAMARQRVRGIYSLKRRRGESVTVEELNVAKNRSWRPFQLAFILLSIPALADPKHKDRTEPLQAYADLLWFPTGGGKTEAYLGVAAFTMAIRRLQGKLGGYDGGRGLAVIMRYTLRLLTIQQFQRATALMCAMETIRKGDLSKWGAEPFTLGLWVGNKVTPGTTEQSHDAISAERDGQRGTSATPAQLTFCPWCGTEIRAGRDIHVDTETGRTSICCGDLLSQCEFSKSKSKGFGLPVVVVDDEIYRRPPTMLIGTVDKFAMMAWRGQTRTLFGRASKECIRHGLLWPDADCSGRHNRSGPLPATRPADITPLRPPDLVIQDEFHLISGPLGTMVGLYESAIDELSAWKLEGKTVRPKVIASTATVRKAKEQIHNVFLREVAVFPPHGLDIEDNFFSVQRPVTEKPGRLYLGICSPGNSRPAVLIRLYAALLTAAQSLFDRFGPAADPYMTLVGYFNSLRELGGMRRLAEDDVTTRAFRVQMSRVVRPGLSQRSIKNIDELTSRVSSRLIPKKLDQLEVKFKKSWEKGEVRAMDVVLATNMLSVGVDVNRLGLMAMNGQPKSTAEYIQATSRVGRSFPGIVFTVMTWSRPRDLSHYETFEHYHGTFYKHVEAQSVTPFAPRALDRGLTGTMVSLLRLCDEGLNSNLGAGELATSSRPEAQEAKTTLSARAWKVKNKETGDNTEKMLAERLDRWAMEAGKPGRRLGYETEARQGDVVALLKKPGIHRWDIFTVPMSMREVEPGVKIIMDTSTIDDGPDWTTGTKQSTEAPQ